MCIRDSCTGVVSGVYRTKEELNDRYQEGILRLKESFFAVRSGVLMEMPPAEGTAEVALDGLLHHLKHGNVREMNEEYLKPVSYTHLDVYKRQPEMS